MRDEHDATEALLAELRRLCARLPGAEEYVMVHHPAFRVGKKPFAIAGMRQGDDGLTVSVNLGPELQHELLDDPRFEKTAYLGRHGWVTIGQRALKKGELEALVRESWRRVASKAQRAAHDATR